MKNEHPEITTLAISVNGELVEFPIHTYTTKWLITLLDELSDWDYDFVAPIMSELCERYGLDFADYEACDDCFSAIIDCYSDSELNKGEGIHEES